MTGLDIKEVVRDHTKLKLILLNKPFRFYKRYTLYKALIMAQKILIVEDDQHISVLVAKNLTAAGFQCCIVDHGDRVLRELANYNPALLVLDIQLPGTDGLELIRRIRHRDQIPILLLTARASDADKVLGFEIGADDYLTKPFSVQELIARIRALLRRTRFVATEQEIHAGNLTIDPAKQRVLRGNEDVLLTTLEFDVLHFLVSRAGRVFSREALMNQVWGDSRVVDDRTIDSLISRLRRKLEPNPSVPIYIQTVWGAGYRFPENTN